MVDISDLTTLRTPTKAESVIDIASLDQISHLYSQGLFQKPFYILGLGANVLFKNDFPGNILLVKLKGRSAIPKNSEEISVEFGAGENWHESVMWTVANNWSGMENMTLIPGTVGAAAVGNIAAYGQNQEDILDSLTAINLTTGQTEIFTKSDCRFAYRSSIFQMQFAGKFLVTSVTYKLSPTTHLELSYQATRHASLLSSLEKLHPAPYAISEVAQTVIDLRTAKLPNWTKINTAGSFFKNPVVPRQIAQDIKTQIPDLQIYPAEKLSYLPPGQEADFVKLPAGMLLDQLGWRGKRLGRVSTYPQHALVIIANPGTTGAEIYEFAEAMRADVKNHFAINLEYEVVIV